MSASAARVCAHRTLRRVTEQGAYADRTLHAEAERAGLDARDRAFAQRLAYGAVQRLGAIDHVIGGLSSRPVDEIDPPLLAAARLGVYEVVWLDSVPDRAAVEQAVELAKGGGGGRGAGFVNAVMRRAAREARGIVAALGDATPTEAAVAHSHPEWIVRLWWDALGAEATRALLACDNEPAESAVRVNELRTDRDVVAETLEARGVSSHPAPDLPEGLVLDDPFDVRGSDLFAAGALTPQSRGSMLVSRVLAPEPGDGVLDMCAAPGAKATHLAALAAGRAEVVAVELHDARARELDEYCERMGTRVEVVRGDAREVPGRRFDRVLLDAPCSDLGTLRSRPDARWRKRPEQVDELAALQAELLDAAAERTEPGGTVVFSTCTISPAENEGAADAFLARHDDFTADDLGAEHAGLAHEDAPRYLRLLPHVHGTDGFFVARFRRTA